MVDAVDLQIAEMLRSFLKQERDHGCTKEVCWDWVRAIVADRADEYHLLCILGRCPLSPIGLHLLAPGQPRVFGHTEDNDGLRKVLEPILNQYGGAHFT